MVTSNNVSEIFNELVRLSNNSIAILNALNSVATTANDIIDLTLKDSSGNEIVYKVPSYSYLKSNIARLDTTVSQMLGLDTETLVRLADGTFRKIYVSKLLKNPSPVKTVAVPKNFKVDNNWFFENLYSPILKVSFDVTSYVPQEESKIFYRRFILQLDTPEKLEYWTNNWSGKNDLDYGTFTKQLKEQSVVFSIDDEFLDLPMNVLRYSGNFLVLATEFREDEFGQKSLWYQLDDLEYTDNVLRSTKNLEIGDKLYFQESLFEVRFKQGTWVQFKRLSGYDTFGIGSEISFYSETFTPKVIDVSVGYNEYVVIFFKTINDEKNIISYEYSPGVAFATNSLTITDSSGITTLKDYYFANVLDFGKILLSQTKENKISSLDGIPPVPPVLNRENFKIVQINEHKFNSADLDLIRQKQASKVTLESELQQLDKSIESKKTELNTRKFSNESERRSVRNDLNKLISEKSNKVTLYSTVVKDLNTIAKTGSGSLDSPKYRVRGFFPFPDPRKSEDTQPQEVIQFYVFYRYLSISEGQSNTKQFEFTDENSQKQIASFSNWVVYKTDVRKKIYDEISNRWVWAPEDVENPNIPNINTVDIPISAGEKVEFYVVSVSEAGYPENPLISEPSNTVTIEFPNDLISQNDVLVSLQESVSDNLKVTIESDLNAKGLDLHLSTSFQNIDRYYAHDAESISSNFYTPEGNVISLFEKLKELQLRILDLENQINQIAAEPSIFIVDNELGTKIPVQNSAVVQLFAGYYTEFQENLPAAERVGAIISKQYFVSIENLNASPLELVSRFPGGLGSALPSSWITNPTVPAVYDSSILFPVTSDVEYKDYFKYDQTPIVHLSLTGNETHNANKYTTAFYQSGQTKGQFVYSRYKDITLSKDLYRNPVSPNSRYFVPQNPNFSLDPAHPLWNSNPTIIYDNNIQQTIQLQNGIPVAPEKVNLLRHSCYINEEVNAIGDFSPQLSYVQNFPNTSMSSGTYTTSNPNELPDKFGFVKDDRFLKGQHTVGSYFFLAPLTFNQLNVEGIDARSKYILKPGESNVLQIPLVFQFRMEDYGGVLGGAGKYTSSPANIIYGRRVGIDIYVGRNGRTFSFDVQVNAAYKKTSTVQLNNSTIGTVNKELQNSTFTKESIKTIKF